jgi:hypothetical protein
MKDPNLCGIGWLNTGRNDPMWAACKVHDKDYQDHIDGKTNYKSSSKVDMKFLRNMLLLMLKQPSPTKKLLMLYQIPIYYSLVRAVGSIRWKRLKRMSKAEAKEAVKKPPSEIQKEIDKVRNEVYEKLGDGRGW